MLEPGRIIERYVVEALLGEGGMAAVYRVRHLKLGTSHALKVLTYANKSIRERLEREGQVQASLQHPNTVAVLDVLDVDGAPGLLMEFVDGPDLSRWIQTEDYDLPTAEAVFRGVVSAVGEAHRRGVIHRDLKPANVLMARNAVGWVPKVADFGLAKAVMDGTSTLDKGATRTGVMMGTPAYMAPEQIRDAKNVDQRADVFALGCILYELVTRRQPFQGVDIVELITAVTGGAYVPPRTFVPDLPERFEQTIRACLLVDADARPADCDAVIALLDGASDPRATPMLPPVPRGTRFAETLRDASVAPPSQAPAATPTPATPATPSEASRSALPAPKGMVAAAVAVPVAVLALMVPLALLAVAIVGSWATRGGVDGEDGPGFEDIPGLFGPEEPAYPCGGADGEVVGWALGGQFPMFRKGKGSVWALSAEKVVYTEYPNESNQYADKGSGVEVCRLPTGTRVAILEDTRRIPGKGVWVPIVAQSLTLPGAAAPPPAEGAPSEEVAPDADPLAEPSPEPGATE